MSGGAGGAVGGFKGLPASTRKQVLCWVAAARRPQTRVQRIAAVVEAAAQGRTPLPPQ
ncbi:MAG TPA: YdeI/OmpD-associated family protein [Acidimicrobiia bacterium]|nr:YdeI/OmpD-associated family protein [Acidimicrobiia bacterium]